MTRNLTVGMGAYQAGTPDTRFLASLAPMQTGARFAVHVHLFYFDMWREFADRLSELDIEFDLFVTVTKYGDRSDELRQDILGDFPDAVVVFMPNHGRDIFPFVHLVNAGLLSRYDAICKVHTKKSPHREDGDVWRDHLVSGLMLGSETSAHLDAFLADKTASIWVADGQHYNDTAWWGSNQKHTSDILSKVEIPFNKDRLSFPAGSMYWLKPQLVATIKGLQLTEYDFERELGQVDGTYAHAFERALGYLAEDGGHSIVQTSQLKGAPVASDARKPSFVSAFYLPQFHRVAENDAWWGSGFTEWVAATSAKPNFKGHAQPQVPGALGFYDLRQTEVLGEQAKLARAAGIDAFCTYFYWFDGQRILEEPIDRLLDQTDVEFPFYLCWANESWRRNWDGMSGEILMPQSYGDGFEETLAADTAVYMRDPRYQRPDGVRPRFVIYRPEDMPDPEGSIAKLRQGWRDAGIGEVELGAVLFHVEGEHVFDPDLLDFWVEMPPHNLVKPRNYILGGPEEPQIDLKPTAGFQGLVYDFRGVIANSSSVEYTATLPKNTIAGVMPSWDNTARRGVQGHIAWGANPMTFYQWLRDVNEQRLETSYGEELFVNAWNEWAEKAMLEPSAQYGDAQLRVLSEWT
ncbi:glycoside hydrolase family 99-like domain-containing protein [uncultured Litoreibacter sp.]|uniref:glycoside hydrolase family 99-like domain-containing protein n=1 Tax=uncultured Litoreibacter sp. TaxID=1392394 RepID=UPI002618FFAE|nr:glycoside hydrolase family 99-like domain-containing protein [uncultured Litoreibacter sp.]